MTRRGTLEIDRRFGKLGNLRVASGTRDRELWRRLNDMLTTLREHRQDVLAEVIARRLSPLEVWQYFSKGDLAALPLDPRALLPLFKTMGAWIDVAKNSDGTEVSEKYRESLRISLQHLARYAEAVHEMPKALQRVRDAEVRVHPRTYMMTKAAAMAFARDLGGKKSPLYLACANVPSVRIVAKQRDGLPPRVFKKRVSGLSPEHEAQSWDMATTGMGPDEYFKRKFAVEGERVRIDGTKRERRKRWVPLLRPIRGPLTGEDRYRRALYDAGVGLQPYDMRRCFLHWCDMAGVNDTQVAMLAGHSLQGKKGVTGTYLHHDIRPYLPSIKRKLLRYVKVPGATLRLEKQA